MNLEIFEHLIYLINLKEKQSEQSGKSGANKRGRGWGKTIINLEQNGCEAMFLLP